MQVSRRAKRVWERLIQAYGSRVADSFGAEVPKPWQELIDNLTDAQIAYGLRQVIRESLAHPPTLGQFTKACNDMPVHRPANSLTIQEQLVAFVMAKYFTSPPLAPGADDRQKQVAMPWTFLYRESINAEQPKHLQRGAECTGVVVPAFGDQPSYRVMVVDMTSDRDVQQVAYA